MNVTSATDSTSKSSSSTSSTTPKSSTGVDYNTFLQLLIADSPHPLDHALADRHHVRMRRPDRLEPGGDVNHQIRHGDIGQGRVRGKREDRAT